MIPMIILAIENEVDRTFMEQVYLRYRKLMFSQVLKIIDNPWDAEEIVQTAVVSLVEQVDLLKTMSGDKQTNYIITVAKNEAYTFLRKQRRSKSISLDDDETNLYNYLESPTRVDDALIREATSAEFHSAWQKIETKNKDVLTWRYYLGYTHEQIAKEMKIKPSSVRMVLTRARQDLYSELKKLERIKL